MKASRSVSGSMATAVRVEQVQRPQRYGARSEREVRIVPVEPALCRVVRNRRRAGRFVEQVRERIREEA
jgi:hypothetical protein